MKTLMSIIGGIMLLMSGIIGYQYALMTDFSVSSANVGNEYNYIQLTGSVSSSSVMIGGTDVSSSSAATLGSIIITEDSALAIDVWDATSTEAIGNAYATKVADMQAALTEGTYIFDINLRYGLVLNTTDWTAFAGDWTITWR